ncbi:SH3 domain-containing protein, partial [Streptomyces sp. NPDC002285]
ALNTSTLQRHGHIRDVSPQVRPNTDASALPKLDNGWNYRTGPSAAYASRGYLYRGDKLTVLCSRGDWNYSQLTQRSTSGIPKGTRGWVRNDGLYQLAG